jgi:hypothetical protein
MEEVMPTTIGIIIAALIVTAGIILTQRYQIAAAVDADGKPFVWRIDKLSGEIESCSLFPEVKWTVKCGTHP